QRLGRRSEERVRLDPLCALEALTCGGRGHVEEQHWHPRVAEVRGNLRSHRPGTEHGRGTDVHHGPQRLPTPPTNRSTIASASLTSEYLRWLRIQLVAISSSAPKNSLAASVGLMSARNTPAV